MVSMSASSGCMFRSTVQTVLLQILGRLTVQLVVISVTTDVGCRFCLIVCKSVVCKVIILE